MVETPSAAEEETSAAPAEPSPLPSVWRIWLAPGGNVKENWLPEPRTRKLSGRGEPSSRVSETVTVAFPLSVLVSRMVVRRLPAAVAPSRTWGR